MATFSELNIHYTFSPQISVDLKLLLRKFHFIALDFNTLVITVSTSY